jgi:glutamate N-acetyltransferase/amino-acid N-acetyltransferase
MPCPLETPLPRGYTGRVEEYASESEYVDTLTRRAVLPEGFRCAVRELTFHPREKEAAQPLKMNLSVLLLDRETPDFGAVFTRNLFPGAPVIIGRERLGRPAIRGVLANNRISNVCTPHGTEDARQMLDRLGEMTGAHGEDFFCASTGIIGWALPVREMTDALPALLRGLSASSILPMARGIMTTDAYPKVREAQAGKGRIVGIAKGAGMMEPNMATMLCFLCTDVAVPRDRLREDLSWAVERTLNRLSVDGDQSTSDTAIILSSGLKGPADPGEFRAALREVLAGLAFDIVRNGEGTGHAIRVRVLGARDETSGLGVARAVANSPLVKTAVFGNDPNVGRIISAVGDFLGNTGGKLDAGRAAVTMGGEEVFSGGCFRLDAEKERRLSQYLRSRALDTRRVPWPQHDRTVDIEITLDGASPAVEILGSDLSYDYVRENADYRS